MQQSLGETEALNEGISDAVSCADVDGEGKPLTLPAGEGRILVYPVGLKLEKPVLDAFVADKAAVTVTMGEEPSVRVTAEKV